MLTRLLNSPKTGSKMISKKYNHAYLTVLWICLLLLQVCAATAQTAQIPFQMQNGHVLIRVRVGQQDSLQFVFDTGATVSSLDSAAAVRAGIRTKDVQQVSVTGAGGAQQYLMLNGQNLQVGNLPVKHVNLVLIDFKNLSTDLGIHLDGIIGLDVLNKYVTKIDFEEQLLSFYPAIQQVDTTGFAAIPFEFSKGIEIPRFPVSIVLNNGETFTGKTMFDLGNAGTLLISAPYSKFHQLETKLGKMVPHRGRGLNVATDERLAKINSMHFNGFEFGRMPVSLTINEAAVAKDGYLGILGTAVISHFHVILDYGAKMIYLQPNKNYLASFSFKGDAHALIEK